MKFNIYLLSPYYGQITLLGSAMDLKIRPRVVEYLFPKFGKAWRSFGKERDLVTQKYKVFKGGQVESAKDGCDPHLRHISVFLAGPRKKCPVFVLGLATLSAFCLPLPFALSRISFLHHQFSIDVFLFEMLIHCLWKHSFLPPIWRKI